MFNAITKKDMEPTQVSAPQVQEEKKDCAVCLSKIEANINLASLRCGHAYHSQCISEVFSSSPMHMRCPLCRSTVDLRKESLQIELDARKAILDRYPTSAVAHHNYAHALKRGVFENNTPDTRVFKLFTQAVELDPTNPTLWISLANNMPCYVEEVALKLENSDTAVHLNRHQCYQRALELDPDNQD